MQRKLGQQMLAVNTTCQKLCMIVIVDYGYPFLEIIQYIQLVERLTMYYSEYNYST